MKNKRLPGRGISKRSAEGPYLFYDLCVGPKKVWIYTNNVTEDRLCDPDHWLCAHQRSLLIKTLTFTKGSLGHMTSWDEVPDGGLGSNRPFLPTTALNAYLTQSKCSLLWFPLNLYKVLFLGNYLWMQNFNTDTPLSSCTSQENRVMT